MSLIATGLLTLTTLVALLVNSTTNTPQSQTSHDKARALRLRIRLARSATELDKLELEARRLANTTPNFTAWTRCLNAEISNKRSQLKTKYDADRD